MPEIFSTCLFYTMHRKHPFKKNVKTERIFIIGLNQYFLYMHMQIVLKFLRLLWER